MTNIPSPPKSEGESKDPLVNIALAESRLGSDWESDLKLSDRLTPDISLNQPKLANFINQKIKDLDLKDHEKDNRIFALFYVTVMATRARYGDYLEARHTENIEKKLGVDAETMIWVLYDSPTESFFADYTADPRMAEKVFSDMSEGGFPELADYCRRILTAENLVLESTKFREVVSALRAAHIVTKYCLDPEMFKEE